MTPEAFREHMASLYWGATVLAKVLNCDDRLVRRWMSGERPIPTAIGDWIKKRAELNNACPPPGDWKSR